MHNCFVKLCSIFLLALLLVSLPITVTSVQAFSNPYLITNGIPSSPAGFKGVSFFVAEFTIDYQGGQVILSGNPDGTGDTVVDDGIGILVTRPGGARDTFTWDYSTNCTEIKSLPPKDISSYFSIGVNTVRVRLHDICGAMKGSSSMYLVNRHEVSNFPSPFLELPWDYKSKGMSFTEAALAINSFFDHEYPLLSTGVSEVANNSPDNPDNGKIISTIVKYNNFGRENKSYSSHDGYDYGTPAKVEFKEPLLAAADGILTYHPSSECGACGHSVRIDHQNGYQTRYYHLHFDEKEEDGLITKDKNAKIPVKKGDQIGWVGFTGNVRPKGEDGAHIHFMVIEDKNKDGNFDDNIPDGLTDPFGWQSEDEDPWEVFTFNYLGKERTGNKSFYLWKEKIEGLKSNLPENGGIFNTKRFEFNFPPGAVKETTLLTLEPIPVTKVSENIESLGTGIKAQVKNPAGEIISQFEAAYTLSVDFSKFVGNRFKEETISIFSSEDGDHWEKEETIVDWENEIATAILDHMTYFIVAAERVDTVPPETIATVDGEKGEGNWFRSDVQVTLNSIDNHNGLGVEFTAFKINDGDWEEYKEPILISEQGEYTLYFYAVDQDENVEEAKEIELSIDKTPPVVKANASREPDSNEWYTSSVQIQFEGEDDLSGINNCSEINFSGPDGDNVFIEGWCFDRAGNKGLGIYSLKYDATAPEVVVNPTPNILWPPNGKMVDVQILGMVNESHLESLSFLVEDEYGELSPSINNFGDVIQLKAERNGQDNDGRDYKIRLNAYDKAGNTNEVIQIINVPHDQEKRTK